MVTADSLTPPPSPSPALVWPGPNVWGGCISYMAQHSTPLHKEGGCNKYGGIWPWLTRRDTVFVISWCQSRIFFSVIFRTVFQKQKLWSWQNNVEKFHTVFCEEFFATTKSQLLRVVLGDLRKQWCVCQRHGWQRKKWPLGSGKQSWADANVFASFHIWSKGVLLTQWVKMQQW